MEIHIDDSKKLDTLKEEFSSRFPYLKIEFFNHSHHEGSGSPKSDMIVEDLEVGSIRSKHNEGDVTIHGELSVGELEQEFEKKYGMHVQVFRKSGNLWLETSATDDWTLELQNTTGKEMSEN